MARTLLLVALTVSVTAASLAVILGIVITTVMDYRREPETPSSRVDPWRRAAESAGLSLVELQDQQMHAQGRGVAVQVTWFGRSAGRTEVRVSRSSACGVETAALTPGLQLTHRDQALQIVGDVDRLLPLLGARDRAGLLARVPDGRILLASHESDFRLRVARPVRQPAELASLLELAIELHGSMESATEDATRALLDDPSPVVRLAAARVLADVESFIGAFTRPDWPLDIREAALVEGMTLDFERCLSAALEQADKRLQLAALRQAMTRAQDVPLAWLEALEARCRVLHERPSDLENQRTQRVLIAMAELLGLRGTSDAEPLLLELLDAQGPGVRREVLAALALVGGEAGLHAADRVSRADPDTDTRVAAAEATRTLMARLEDDGLTRGAVSLASVDGALSLATEQATSTRQRGRAEGDASG